MVYTNRVFIVDVKERQSCKVLQAPRERNTGRKVIKLDEFNVALGDVT